MSQVDQAPSQQLLDACSVVMKALVEEPLLKHFDNDVKVFLAACLCEVARIMAPKSPYEDPEMKVWDYQKNKDSVLDYFVYLV